MKQKLLVYRSICESYFKSTSGLVSREERSWKERENYYRALGHFKGSEGHLGLSSGYRAYRKEHGNDYMSGEYIGTTLRVQSFYSC